MSELRKKRNCNKAHDSICWKCRKSSGGRGCPWADKFEPVPGWEAIEGKIWFTSKYQDGTAYRHETPTYDVHYCPLFEMEGKEKIKLNDEAVVRLAAEVYIQAVKDKKRLARKGNPPQLLESTGEILALDEVYGFFRTKWADILAGGVTEQHTPAEFRKALGIGGENEAVSR